MCSHGLAVRGFGLVASGQTAGISGEKNLLAVNGNNAFVICFSAFQLHFSICKFLIHLCPLV